MNLQRNENHLPYNVSKKKTKTKEKKQLLDFKKIFCKNLNKNF